MAKRVIGQSISEAIDWAQDTMRTTRPIAETVLFSMIKDRKVTEANDGFLFETTEDDEEDKKDMDTRKSRARTQFNYTTRRKGFVERREVMRQRLKAMGYTEELDAQIGIRSRPDDIYFDSNYDATHSDIAVSRDRMPAGWV
jgi:hypothetical protein